MAWTPPDWFTGTRLGAWLTARISSLGDVWDGMIRWWSRNELRREGRMFKIGVVGDLSLQDPQRLWRCLSAACAACDIVVQVGDCHPGYGQMKQAAIPAPQLKVGWEAVKAEFFAVPGNHDIDWDAKLGWPRTWRCSYQWPGGIGDPAPAGKSAFHLVGLDNSGDRFTPSTWSVLDSVPADGAPLLVFVHKPLSTIVLQDGSESNHIMGEGALNADAERLKEWCSNRRFNHVAQGKINGIEPGNPVMLIHGHYHAYSEFFPGYCPCIVEGRGGAAGTGPGEIGWTMIIVTPEGLTLHKVDL